MRSSDRSSDVCSSDLLLDFEMSQPGFFVLENRYAGLDPHGDPLVAINASVPFELFRLDLKPALVTRGLRRAAAEALSQAVGAHRRAVSAAPHRVICAQESAARLSTSASAGPPPSTD